jgi:23S rRNA (cytidine2498-2'-O)-methyltransferase
VLDCILVEPDEWWFGFHHIRSIPSRWPGGIFHLPEPPDDMVSRAYVKMREALAWSRLPVKRGETVAEIGSAPGGASQALLSRGLKVIGIDPATMDERVLKHPKLTHIQKRGHEVRRREFRGVRWLMADINVAPQYTLDTVEGIVTHPAVKIEGLLLTLKLLEWKLTDEVPGYLDRVRSWGYGHVAARQLSHNRQEICLSGTRAAKSGR